MSYAYHTTLFNNIHGSRNICFVDFAQAYDSLCRKVAWELLPKYANKHLKCIIAAKALYSVVSAMTDGEECDRQTDKQTDRQTDILIANSALRALRDQKH